MSVLPQIDQIAMEAGADDYLDKDRLSPELLERTIRYALERQRYADALSRSERRFRALVQNASDLIVVLYESGTFTYVSPSCAAILGHDPDEMIGKSLQQFIHLEDSAEIVEFLTHRRVRRRELRCIHADGEWRVLEVTGTSLLDDPAVQGIVLNAWDVTGLKRLEEELIYHSLHDPVTGLPNRILFDDRVTHALGRMARQEDRLLLGGLPGPRRFQN